MIQAASSNRRLCRTPGHAQSSGHFPHHACQRGALVEHLFGTMKRAMDQGSFLLTGLTNVRGEFRLTVLASNLKRVLNLMGVPRLLAAIA